MKLGTIRALFGLGLVAGIILFALMLWDYTSNDSDAFVLLTILFIVLIVLLLLMFFLLRVDEEPVAFIEVRPEPEKEKPYYDYKGDVHDVIDVEGIGPVYAERLAGIGIKTTARLCYEDTASIAQRIGVPEKTVRSWQAMAQLMKVNGIAKQYAEALYRGGTESIEDLKKGDAAEIAAAAAAYLESVDVNVLGQPVTTKRVQGWQRKVKPMRRVRQPIPPE